MSYTITLEETVKNLGTPEVTKSQDFTADSLDQRELSVADSTTDQLVTIAIDVDQVALFEIVSNQDVTIETNDGTTPDDTLSLTAGVPYIWTSASLHSFLLTTDVTALYITNSSGSTATINIVVLQDSTP